MLYNSRQCRLRRGNIQTTLWLPEKYAVKGGVVTLKQDGQWVDGWLVESVSEVSMPCAEVRERSQDYKKQRQASDI